MLKKILKNFRHAVTFAMLTLVGTHVTVHDVSAQTDSAVRGLPDFTSLVERVGPSVVNIRTIDKPSQLPGSLGRMPDEEMLDFFRRFGIPIPNNPKSQKPQRPHMPDEAQPRGVGSGFLLTQDGYVMTNAHVVDGADEVLVTLTDKREFKAKLIGADKRTDVAVVKIDAQSLPAVRIGDINRLKVGEWVMAIGSPFGLDNTVTAGIVSAKQRDTGEYLPFIQTDVAINPGNSGGPLINMRGEVVGINSQIYSRSGGFMGISFAIPIDEAIRVSEQLRSSGKVSRGRLGVQIGSVTKEMAENLGLSKSEGALVTGVEVGSPAEKAGIEVGDVIVRFDERAVEKVSDLPRLVGNTKPGSKSVVTIFRKGSNRDIPMVIGEMDSDKAVLAVAPSSKASKSAASKILGLVVSDITEKQKKDLKINGGVSIIEASEHAAKAGLKEGDVIVGLQNNKISNIKDFEGALQKIDAGKSVNIIYRRGDWTQYVLINPTRQ